MFTNHNFLETTSASSNGLCCLSSTSTNNIQWREEAVRHICEVEAGKLLVFYIIHSYYTLYILYIHTYVQTSWRNAKNKLCSLGEK